MSKVLVTGGSGFVARYALDFLKDLDLEIHAADICPTSGEHSHIQWHQADLLDFSQIHRMMETIQPEYLLHFAWTTTPGQYWNSADNITWVQAGLELLRSFHQNGGRRFVAAGSCAEYDWKCGYCSESDTPRHPNSLYGAAKRAYSQVVAHYCHTHGLSYAWGYIFYLYGPFEKNNRLIPLLMHSILTGKELELSSPSDIRDFLYVEDVARAFVQLLQSDYNGEVNIASAEPVSIEKITATVTEYLGGQELIRYRGKTGAHSPKILVGDNELLREKTDWQQQYSLAEGIRKTADWWKSRLKQDDQEKAE